MAKIKESYLVKKRNVLNELRANNMTLQELRFFSIYLSKINPNDLSTRIVRFTLADFQKIMELGRINIDYFKDVTDSLLCKIVRIPLDNHGSYTAFQLFKECTVKIDNSDNGGYIEIDAHDKALPLMFEFKDRYFSYQLWNALRLKSSNQLRMYEILKQYERAGERVISVQDLKELLWIGSNEYPRFNDFKQWVLDVCQRALSENTDIKFTYEPTGKRGKGGNGGKILNLKFKIEKNTGYIDQLTLFDFIKQQPVVEAEVNRTDGRRNDENSKNPFIIQMISDACMGEFSAIQLDLLFAILKEKIPPDDANFRDYISLKYKELCYRAEKTKIINRFAYFKWLIQAKEGSIENNINKKPPQATNYTQRQYSTEHFSSLYDDSD